MPLGIIIDSLAILVGGYIGSYIRQFFSPSIREQLNRLMGLCSLAMGIVAIHLMKQMPAVILALILGTSLGLYLHLEKRIYTCINYLQMKLFQNKSESTIQEHQTQLLTLMVLFCASGTGIYGALESGMTGEHTILISKAILDCFTAAIFACQLGAIVSTIALPQFLFFTSLFYAAGLVLPFVDATMLADFKACGGLIMLATGCRMLNIKDFPIADMIPAMFLIFPLSWLWEIGVNLF